MGTKKRIILVYVTVLLSLLSCTIAVGGPSYPEEKIPVSTEAVGELQKSIATAVFRVTTSGEVTIVISEAQLTSYLAYFLQKQDQPFITDPQVYLREGQVKVYGTVQRGLLKATACIILTPKIDAQGQLQLELSSADFGHFPVPTGLRETITAIISEAYTGALGPVATGFRIKSIVIANGLALIVGQVK